MSNWRTACRRRGIPLPGGTCSVPDSRSAGYDHEIGGKGASGSRGQKDDAPLKHHASPDFWVCYRFRSVRVGGSYRAVAVKGADGFVWFWMGTHADYDKLLG